MVQYEPFRSQFISMHLLHWCVLLALLVFLASFTTSAEEVLPSFHNDFISHLEPASYDHHQLQRQHRRLRRDVRSSQENTGALRLDVQAFNRTYKLRLFPDTSLFSNDVTFEGSRGPVTFDHRRAYRGTLDDDPEVQVHGVITSEGLFDGSISYRDADGEDHVYIEPASRYLISSPRRGTSLESDNPHSLAYRASDVKPPEAPLCASKHLHERLATEKQQKSAATRRKRWLSSSSSSSSNIPRQVRAASIDPDKTTCMLYLQADHLFHQKFGSEEACIEVMTRHVQRVNSIYQGTDFDQDGKADNISFMIKRIKVHSADALNESTYRFPGNYGVEKFLELFSEEDYDAFCLAYMFTYRDFEMGTLGLAWTGDLKNAGGVCEKNGHYRGSMKSLNTGIVTLLNYGKHVPPAVSHVTLAHEIGHNFGSPHDPDTCTPGGEDGNFIMFARATSGDKRNNNHFSPCSLQAISPVLASKARSTRGCFTEPQAAICGNGVVESGEECDCGWETDCRDKCCFPMSSQPRPGEPPCRLTPRSACSPSQGPCCTGECQLKFGDKCRDDNGCRDASHCDGRGPACPNSINKPNKTVCNEEFVCFMGECTGSICLAYGLESCQCLPSPRDPPTKACELCCKSPGDDQLCLSSFDWNLPPFDIPDLYSKPGTPCNNYNGYCDVFQKCREVDPSGPLATLRKLLLSDESLATVRRWIGQHWYILLLGALVLTAILIMIARIFGRTDDSKLRSVTIMHSGNGPTEPVRLPPGTGLTVHPAIRSKLPLGMRVRGKVSKNKKSHQQQQQPSQASPPTFPTSPAPAATVAAPVEARSRKKRKKRRKEVIDYSEKQGAAAVSSKPIAKTTPECTPNGEDPLGKVRNWLIHSNPAPPQASSKQPIPKSKSTPAVLQTPNVPPTLQIPPATNRPSPPANKPEGRSKSRSLGNLQAKAGARLQLLCRPPFRLTVKLRRSTREEPANNKTANNKSPRRKPALGPVANRGRAALLIRGGRGGEGLQDKRGSKQAETSRNKKVITEDPDVSIVPSDKAVLLNGATGIA